MKQLLRELPERELIELEGGGCIVAVGEFGIHGHIVAASRTPGDVEFADIFNLDLVMHDEPIRITRALFDYQHGGRLFKSDWMTEQMHMCADDELIQRVAQCQSQLSEVVVFGKSVIVERDGRSNCCRSREFVVMAGIDMDIHTSALQFETDTSTPPTFCHFLVDPELYLIEIMNARQRSQLFKRLEIGGVKWE